MRGPRPMPGRETPSTAPAWHSPGSMTPSTVSRSWTGPTHPARRCCRRSPRAAPRRPGQGTGAAASTLPRPHRPRLRSPTSRRPTASTATACLSDPLRGRGEARTDSVTRAAGIPPRPASDTRPARDHDGRLSPPPRQLTDPLQPPAQPAVDDHDSDMLASEPDDSYSELGLRPPIRNQWDCVTAKVRPVGGNMVSHRRCHNTVHGATCRPFIVELTAMRSPSAIAWWMS